MERLRIGLFTNNYLPMLGGVSTAVETLRSSLEGLGHGVVVVAPRMARSSPDPPGIIRVPALPAPTYPEFSLPLPGLWRLQRSIQALDLDIVHAQHPFLLGDTARRIARASGRPLVFTYHTLYDKYAHYVPLPRRIVARAATLWSTRFANFADLVIAPSDALAARLRNQGVRRLIEVVPTGVDLDRFQPGDRAGARLATGLPTSGPLLLYVGRLDREKNLVFLLHVFDRVAARHPTARLALVGRGTQDQVLRAAARHLAAAKRVHFVGGVPPPYVANYYRAADLFVFASTTETQGLAVVEALASGLPVVAVRAPGVEEAIIDGVAGLLVPEDVGTFGSAVLELLGDPALVEKLATGARESARRFAAPMLAARLLAAYRRLGMGSRGAASWA